MSPLKRTALGIIVISMIASLSGCSKEKKLKETITELNDNLAEKDAIITEYQRIESQYNDLVSEHEQCESEKEQLLAEIESLQTTLENLKKSQEEPEEVEEIKEADRLYVLDTTKLGDSELDMGDDYREYPIFYKHDYYGEEFDYLANHAANKEELREYKVKALERIGNYIYTSGFNRYTITTGDDLKREIKSGTMYMYINDSGVYANIRPLDEVLKDLEALTATDSCVKVPSDAVISLNDFLSKFGMSDSIKDNYTQSELELINSAINDKSLEIAKKENGLTRIAKSYSNR